MDHTMVNSPLTAIPSSVCLLTKLRSLQLHHNKLSKLPVGCFTVMEELEEFVVSDNELTEIQVRAAIAVSCIMLYY
jgi:Leucine-rich repeat (LRR) protein